ncbi:MAG: hypothetical protein HN742_38760 [Lentisphaerae bacterium]|jgi:hypothetical protein|nr:hypothetical protein [Lentisphaerota bacterium]MBT4816637.1 hypothetical protein [Lentisphaerota bacterium]MBT5606396.1 hypothetical protein [Lentisphaerota bacterium]MBT7059752.1 hypothetical protein [Lentisphaerota bacterium]MBT7847872.1 hypothetical protein [Lentisphaerota bacterium]
MTRQSLASTRLPALILCILGVVLLAAGIGRVYNIRFQDAPDASETLNDRDMVIQATTGGVTREDGSLAYTRKQAPPETPPECTTPGTESELTASPEEPTSPPQDADVTEKAEVAGSEPGTDAKPKEKSAAPPAKGDDKEACPT